MNINWINTGTNHFNGAFMTMRSHREADGTIRLTLYFSAHAAKKLELRKGERLLVGLDDAGTSLVFKQTLFGGNVMKGREPYDALYCAVTLPLQKLPEPQFAKEEDVLVTHDHMAVPFSFDAGVFTGFRRAIPTLAAAA